ncbi:MAG: alpha/beta fold hydrolase [Lachnospiraceae bacterium]
MKTENIQLIGANGVMLSGIIWEPVCTPGMVLQISHGMTEHIGRYEGLAEKLTARGVVVAGFDLRGHGKNPGDSACATFGEGGWEASLQDMHLFYMELESRFPNLPHFMMGFSLGSFLLRDFLGFYDDKTAGAAILGTGQQPGIFLSVLMKVVKKEINAYGFDSSTELVDKMSFENYNRKFAPNKTPFDWLCADEEQREIYSKDTLCRKHISAGLFYQLMDAMRRTGNSRSYRNWNREMPVLLLSGQDDPVGDLGKGVWRVRNSMNKAGVKDVQIHIIPDARHDLLHEEKSGSAEKAEEILLNWLFEKASPAADQA